MPHKLINFVAMHAPHMLEYLHPSFLHLYSLAIVCPATLMRMFPNARLLGVIFSHSAFLKLSAAPNVWAQIRRDVHFSAWFVVAMSTGIFLFGTGGSVTTMRLSPNTTANKIVGHADNVLKCIFC